MTWIIKNIQIIFLFLAVLVLNAHMIIPHDHHQAESDLCSENSYPVSNTGSTHHHGLPGHCHAFNDLASEKISSCFINKLAPVRDLILDRVTEVKIAGMNFPLTRHVDLFISPVMKGLPGLTSLRAPPLLS